MNVAWLTTLTRGSNDVSGPSTALVEVRLIAEGYLLPEFVRFVPHKLRIDVPIVDVVVAKEALLKGLIFE